MATGKDGTVKRMMDGAEWHMMSAALGYSECAHCHAFTDDMYYSNHYGLACYGCIRTGQYA